MKERKIIVIINGKGGTGKDTLIKGLIDSAYDEDAIQVISAIDPIKDLAKKFGYDENNKDLKARKFLSDLKAAFIAFNDYPTLYLMSKVDEMLNSDKVHALFVHIREPEEIEKFKQLCLEKINAIDMDNSSCFSTCEVVTLLVRRSGMAEEIYGNSSDDNVENYEYDYVFDNNFSINEAISEFIIFFSEMVLPLVTYV